MNVNVYENKYKNFIDNNPYPRKLKSLEFMQGSSFVHLCQNRKKLINFSTSDYLGLSRDPFLVERSQEYAKKYGVGGGASRLVTGNLSLYDELESKLAAALKKPAALIMGAGYQTNISVLEALLDSKILGGDPLVFCDRLAHVSMLTSTRHLATVKRFQHNNLNHLQELLDKYAHLQQPKFILVESVYSMEGDKADLACLTYLAKQYQAFLYVDDAHAVGVYGKEGWGMASEYNVESLPLVMGTFSKALGSYGAYLGCSAITKDYLINKCKGLIYSTALSPAVLGAISAVIDILPELKQRREKILKDAEKLRDFFQKNGLECGNSNTHIVPWIIGDAAHTRLAAKHFEELGILGTAIQPPSVPIEKSRIRFCMTASHTEEDIEYLMSTILKVAERL